MRTNISFFLNGVEQIVSDVQPDTTLLNWLRLEKSLSGTKEGCAEGDCGACTVVVAEANGNSQKHLAKGVRPIKAKAVNACILFLPMLDGLSVTTVEGLAGPNGELHPVQEAIITHHGAQCGFCTPGFVMSLYAGFLNGLDGSEQQINHLFAGNLCRCTGYGPLVKAALSLAHQTPPDWANARLEAEWLYLQSVSAATDPKYDLAIEGPDQAFYAPTSLSALEHLSCAYPDATFVAGATDIGLWVTKQHRQINRFIAIGRVTELKEISKTETQILIGAGVSHSDAMLALADVYPGLAEVWHRFGSMQVRNSGTVGGNIANGSPIGDMSPCLLALNAEVTLNKGGKRRQVPLKDFFVAYGKQDRQKEEFLENLILPRLGKAEHLYAYKISKRFDQDISAVLMAAWLKHDQGKIKELRLGFGGMAAIPSRALRTEEALIDHDLNQPLPTEAISALAQDFQPITDMRASAEYRMAVAENLLRKMLFEAAADDHGMRLYSSPLIKPDPLASAALIEASDA